MTTSPNRSICRSSCCACAPSCAAGTGTATASAPRGSEVLQFAGNEVDFRAFRGRSWNGEVQELTEKEAMILKVLAEKPGEIVSREDLLEKVWGYDVFPSTRTVDNFILQAAQALRTRSRELRCTS